MASSMAFKFGFVMLLCMVVGAPLAQAAITCGQVISSLGSCINYLKTGTGPLTTCCNGIKALNAAAATPQDRQQACTCIKNVAGTTSGINYGLANALTGKCGVSIPYKISPSTDCKRFNYLALFSNLLISWSKFNSISFYLWMLISY
ncbi:Plant lipid transfer protein/Par allergen [Corchorus olitorius]|uniref:Non-specific lipid-transfer protein n=1 Tax=Corchorus olitorius TaxID=93759 RepID=A0A1R3JHW2_9ROSI|nr:Plant lipid transfer protein/Par allergen [Corchorus olitorius]